MPINAFGFEPLDDPEEMGVKRRVDPARVAALVGLGATLASGIALDDAVQRLMSLEATSVAFKNQQNSAA